MGNAEVNLLVDILGLVMERGTVPSAEQLARLSSAEREEIIDWAGFVHSEAGDNNVLAGAAPEALRKLLPSDHYLHKWREGQKNRPYGRCGWGGEDDQCEDEGVCLRSTPWGEMSVCRTHLEAPIDGE